MSITKCFCNNCKEWKEGKLVKGVVGRIRKKKENKPKL